jgi:hypothetical protein
VGIAAKTTNTPDLHSKIKLPIFFQFGTLVLIEDPENHFTRLARVDGMIIPGRDVPVFSERGGATSRQMKIRAMGHSHLAEKVDQIGSFIFGIHGSGV